MNTESYQVCTKTVLDSSYPGIKFDRDGICNQYWEFQRLLKSRWKPNEMGKRELERQVEAIKESGNGSEFDCLLGLSGGVDSCYMLHVMVKEYGLRPLVFHVDGGWNSELAVSNVQMMVEKLGLELYTEVINWEEMRDFQLAWFKSGVPHIDIPQDHAFIAVLYHFAERYKIQTILNGGNIATECVSMPYQYYYWGTDMVHIRDVIRRFGTVPMQSYPFSSVFRHKIYLRYVKNVKVLRPLNLVHYTKKAAIDLLEREYGWKPYPRKHFESRFTKFYESYWLPTRFGFDVRRAQYSSLILTGQMTRDEALKDLERPPFDPATIEEEFDYIATKLQITSSELRGYHQQPKKFYWDYDNRSRILSLIEEITRILNIGRRGGAF